MTKSTFKPVGLEADLSTEWVDDTLVTAFDGMYGGCWYWVNEEEDITAVRILPGEEPDGVLDDRKRWVAVEIDLKANADVSMWRTEVLRAEGRVAVVDKKGLDWAWGHIVTEGRDTATYRQLMEAMRTGDADIDAEGADVLVQVALFGEIVFG